MRRWIGMWLLGLACSTVAPWALAQPPGAGGGRGNFGGGTPPLPEELDFEDGVATIPDHKTYQALSYKGGQVAPDGFLSGLEFVKFTIADVWSDKPKLYSSTRSTIAAIRSSVRRSAWAVVAATR